MPARAVRLDHVARYRNTGGRSRIDADMKKPDAAKAKAREDRAEAEAGKEVF
jgi:hypothetical protein